MNIYDTSQSEFGDISPNWVCIAESKCFFYSNADSVNIQKAGRFIVDSGNVIFPNNANIELLDRLVIKNDLWSVRSKNDIDDYLDDSYSHIECGLQEIDWGKPPINTDIHIIDKVLNPNVTILRYEFDFTQINPCRIINLKKETCIKSISIETEESFPNPIEIFTNESPIISSFSLQELGYQEIYVDHTIGEDGDVWITTNDSSSGKAILYLEIISKAF